MFKDGILEDSTLSEAILSSYQYPVDSDFDDNVSVHFYIASSVVIDSNRTIIKTFDLEFSNLDKSIDFQTMNYKNEGEIGFTSLLTNCEYSNKTVVDLEIQADSLWVYSYEAQNCSKSSSSSSISGEPTAMTYRSHIDRYTVAKGNFSKDSTPKSLKNSVWSANDQLLLERIEDKENINQAILNNQSIKSRYLRRYGGDYVENIPIEDFNQKTPFIK